MGLKILVIRFSSLGDVILTTPVFANVKAHWPDGEVTVLTKSAYAAVFAGHPAIDHVRLYDPARQPFFELVREVRRERFDVVIDLQGNLRSWCVRLLAGAPMATVVRKGTFFRRMLVWCKWRREKKCPSVRERNLSTLSVVGVPVTHHETRIYPQMQRALAVYGLEGASSLIGIAPGARHATKRWPAERFAQLARVLAEETGATMVLLGDKNDRLAADEIVRCMPVPCKDLVGWTTLGETVTILSRFSLLVANDSGLVHVAEALGVPVVALFGPTVPAFGFAPYRTSSRVVQREDLSCRPCSLHGGDRCPLTHHACLREIGVETVLAECRTLLSYASLTKEVG